MKEIEREDLFDSTDEIVLEVVDGEKEDHGRVVGCLANGHSYPRPNVPPPSTPSGADAGFAATILMWFQNEHKQILDKTISFVQEQQELLEEHKGAMAFLLLEQRSAFEQALSMLSQSAPLARCKADTFRDDTSLDFEVDSATDATLLTPSVARGRRHFTSYTDGSDATFQRDRHSVSSSSSRCTPINDVIVASAPLFMPSDRIGSTIPTFFIQDRALRMHLAYQNAAKKLREKSALTRLHERIGRVYQHDILVKTRIFGCACQQQLVEGHRFQCVIAGLILLNAMFIGITSDISAKTSIESHDKQSVGVFDDIPMPQWAVFVDLIFNVAFITELVFRVVVLESRFFVGPEWRWNLFDTILVLLSIVEMFLVSSGFNPSFMRVLRVVRVSRSLRMLRLMRFTHLVRKLRLMTVAIINCSMMLMWAVVVLIIVTFLFSVILLNATAQYVSDASPGNEYVDGIKIYFSSLFMTMVTLFMAVAGGVDWWEVLRIFLEIHVLYGVLFMLFIIITVLAVLNVINAIFVNDAMESTRTDQDLLMQGELEETKLMLERLTGLFEKLLSAGTGSGEISDRLFVEQVEQEEMKMQFALLGLYYTDGLNFFRLLDIDAKKSLGIDQFVMGCLRLKGGALLIDNNVLVEDTKRLVESMGRANRKAIETIASQVQLVHEKLDEFDFDGNRRDRGIRKTLGGRRSSL